MLGVEMFKKLVNIDVSVLLADSLACLILESKVMIYWFIVLLNCCCMIVTFVHVILIVCNVVGT